MSRIHTPAPLACQPRSFSRVKGLRVCGGKSCRTPIQLVHKGHIALIDVLDLCRTTALDLLRQRALDEGVDVAVEHLLWIAALCAGAQILDQLVGLQNIGTDLVAPADLGFCSGR